MPLISKSRIDNLKIDGPGGSNIKSIQRGSTSMINLASVDVTISAIDPSKSVVKASYNSALNTTPSTLLVSAEIINSTTIRFTRPALNSNAGNVEWVVEEYNNVKSKQTGTCAVAYNVTSNTATISSVNTSKSILVWTQTYGDTTDLIERLILTGVLTNSTTLTFACGSAGPASNARTAYWQVIEFN